jgi:hypothetical protein
MRGGYYVLPFLFGLVYLGLVAYILWLATRFVAAIERIARSMEARPRPEA